MRERNRGRIRLAAGFVYMAVFGLFGSPSAPLVGGIATVGQDAAADERPTMYGDPYCELLPDGCYDYYQDSDGDGFRDEQDGCPFEYGTNGGCPNPPSNPQDDCTSAANMWMAGGTAVAGAGAMSLMAPTTTAGDGLAGLAAVGVGTAAATAGALTYFACIIIF